jgi:DNA-binding PadR family transcriptional regulator
MKFLKCIKSNKYFTEGKIYLILDYLENNGYVTVDDTNTTHYLSGEYTKEHFTKEI